MFNNEEEVLLNEQEKLLDELLVLQKDNKTKGLDLNCEGTKLMLLEMAKVLVSIENVENTKNYDAIALVLLKFTKALYV